MKYLVLFLLLLSLGGCRQQTASISHESDLKQTSQKKIEEGQKQIEEKNTEEPDVKSQFSLNPYLLLDKVTQDSLSAYLVTKKTKKAEEYWNEFSDPQVQKEAFTCLESGYEYDKDSMYPVELLLVRSGELLLEKEFTPFQQLSAPFTCFSLISLQSDHLVKIAVKTADGMSSQTKDYLWNTKTDELIEQ